ncbi:MAG TPA: helix-turn-helix domain-containing protein [Caulobacteraceae bacterium]|jgi:AcrR family transcriptional regulator
MTESANSEPDAKTGGKRERTRAALIAATLAVAKEKGFAATSLDEIAARAGMTKGAIYSNFASKAELLLAAMFTTEFTIPPAAPLDAPAPDQVRGMAQGLAAMIERTRGEERFLAEFEVYAITDPEMRQAFADFYTEGFGFTGEYLAKVEGLGGGMSGRDLAVALQCLSVGFVMQSFITPDEVTPQVIEKTLEMLARGLEASSAAN